MQEIIKKNWDKTKQTILFTIIVISLLLLAVVYKGNEKVITKSLSIQSKVKVKESDYQTFKKFLLDQIKSPFINVDYEINKGENIQKILKKYKVKDYDIQKVIQEYKKFGKPNQLLIGNKIHIIIKKGLSEKKNSIIKFSVPITKSTTIEIAKNEENKIIAKKIITKLYKRKIISIRSSSKLLDENFL